MNQVVFTLNGERTEALVEPRLHLADYLRDTSRLTGTHLGCEHGVCGACTVLIDGQPARSCIAFTVACDGRDVRTIEGFEDDALMKDLRTAFTRDHALQCGFCTPGMLIAARDVVMRCPDADDKRIRSEMSGNLCRCTGYLGIANAINSVIQARRGGGATPAIRTAIAANAPVVQPLAKPWQAFTPADAEAAAPRPAVAAPLDDAGPREGWQRIEESFIANHSPGRVWEIFADTAGVAACLPGASIDEATPTSAKGRIDVRFGPMKASFAGATSLERNETRMEGRIRGGGSDSLTGSRAKADITYRLASEHDRTRVSIVMDYNLQGPLAQFSRSGIVKAFAGRMVAQFGENLNAKLGGGSAPIPLAAGRTAELNAGNVLWQWLWSTIKKLLGLTR
ncbi:MAG: 2Fe-2S iron-sulfur cluster binding domain-containing protein [Betaproteobacteria bacterium]|nr:2Fe-2S iron-sulfur cluster binding domain-containing protein [Betaproteobacteria bacterium]